MKILSLLLICFLCSSVKAEEGDANFYVQVSYDPVFDSLSFKEKLETTSERYNGSLVAFSLGYAFNKVDSFVIFKNGQLNYKYDSTEKEGTSSEVGFGIGYKYLKFFSFGLQLSTIKLELTNTTNSTAESYSGLNSELYLRARQNIYKKVYLFGRMTYVIYGKLDTKDGGDLATVKDLTGHSLSLGLGYLF